VLAVVALGWRFAGSLAAEGPADQAPRSPLPVPEVQVIPLPYEQLAFEIEGREVARYHFGPSLPRPFWFPIVGPGARYYTRMGHPHDPVGHSHHNSIWISHADVAGVNFWTDRTPGRIVHEAIEKLEDGGELARAVVRNLWKDNLTGRILLREIRSMEIERLPNQEWYLTLTIALSAPDQEPVVLGQTAFGLLGVRVAKTMSVADGGGRILNSEGQLNEKEAFRRPARWVDYSGPVSSNTSGGITLMDHPANPTFPTPFHVRDDGWMGPSVTLLQPLSITPGKPMIFRYRLWVHGGTPDRTKIEEHWAEFTGS
jgi:hypothetical protein